MFVRAVATDDASGALVAQVRMDRPGSLLRRGPEIRAQMPLPGLVGSSPSWLHVCREIESAFRSGSWLAVEGEPGVGKLALLRAVQLRRQPVGRLVVLDAADAAASPGWLATVRQASLVDADSLVLRHVDRLDPAATRELRSTLSEASGTRGVRPLWTAVTLGPTEKSAELRQLLRLFPSTVEVPPLRLHLEDLTQMVPLFLARIGQGGQLVCSPEAMRLLMRMSWPGNSEQLFSTLRKVVDRRRTGRIEPEDLPAELHALSRRVLTSLESMERDAIVQCLADAGGNKARAARSLGMSRATIYRKIHDYGIVAPAT
jgi:transcriptional regulator of acetoin/glycerol metabolism